MSLDLHARGLRRDALLAGRELRPNRLLICEGVRVRHAQPTVGLFSSLLIHLPPPFLERATVRQIQHIECAVQGGTSYMLHLRARRTHVPTGANSNMLDIRGG